MHKIFFLLIGLYKELWVRCCMFCMLAIFALIIGPIFGPFVSDDFKELVSPETAKELLTILASSMLAVTTFSLSIMVQAYSAASQNASPRANKLLMQNATAQNALGSFIGGFLFSIAGIICISASLYDRDVIFVLFLFTILIIVIIVVMLLRWIDALSRFGQISETILDIESALRQSIEMRVGSLHLGCKALTSDIIKHHPFTIVFSQIGYVQYIDVKKLNNIANKHSITIAIIINTGDFLDSTSGVVCTSKKLNPKQEKEIEASFVIDHGRTFEQDPRYGVVVLSEIAAKALSPAVNDSGTAAHVVSTFIRTVRLWVDTFPTIVDQEKTVNILYPNIYLRTLSENSILGDMYRNLIPCASSHLPVCQHIKKSFEILSRFDHDELTKCLKYWQNFFEESCKENLSPLEYKLLFDNKKC